jgi:hypothetical protein
MRLGPLRETCVQPAPKSRWVSSGLFVYEDQKQIRSFLLKPVLHARAVLFVGPALAGKTPVWSPSIPQNARVAVSGTGFSREDAGVAIGDVAA